MEQFSVGNTYLAYFFMCALLLASGDELNGQNIPIAVLDFEANGISQTEVIALTDRLRNELFRQGKFDVVERGLMEDILLEQDFQLSGCTTDECLVEVGQLIGARQIVGGRISRIENFFTVSARMVDVETGRILKVSDYDLQGDFGEMLKVGMGEVAEMLSLPSVDGGQPNVMEIEQATPDKAQQPTVTSSFHIPRFQIAYGTTEGRTTQSLRTTGTDVRVRWFPWGERQLGSAKLLPALTGGKYSASGGQIGYEEFGTDLLYLLMEGSALLSFAELGLGISLWSRIRLWG